ncbi:unnamed protein product, partial [Didymodactylos carnosus]
MDFWGPTPQYSTY